MTPQEIMVPMQDGVHLQSFVHLPEDEGPFPSLMVRCMYGTDAVLGKTQRFVEEGYAVVAQNVRGRRKSEGGPTGRGDFPEDGFDTMEWMVAQSWCSGRIGTFGGSALARVQAATALLGHPAHRFGSRSTCGTPATSFSPDTASHWPSAAATSHASAGI